MHRSPVHALLVGAGDDDAALLAAALVGAYLAPITVRRVDRLGDVPRGLAEGPVDAHADLIVLGTHGRGGVGRFFLGSVADRVVRMAPCPVVTVREAVEATR